jgi:hypothetical protein
MGWRNFLQPGLKLNLSTLDFIIKKGVISIPKLIIVILKKSYTNFIFIFISILFSSKNSVLKKKKKLLFFIKTNFIFLFKDGHVCLGR